MLMGRAVAAMLVLALGTAGCGDDDAPDASPSTSATEAPSTSSATSTTPGPACDPLALPDGAANITDAAGDVDGDGAQDVLRSYRLGVDDWHLRAELAAGGAEELAVPTFGDGAIVVLGGADVDGDGGDEVWAQTGSGASATIVGLARFTNCTLERVTFVGGDPAEFPVGGSVGNAAGLGCEAHIDPASDLTAYTATNTGEVSYEVTATDYALKGSVLVQGASEVSTATMGDEAFARATTFACDDLSA